MSRIVPLHEPILQRSPQERLDSLFLKRDEEALTAISGLVWVDDTEFYSDDELLKRAQARYPKRKGPPSSPER
jgi:hypothetical protein